MAALKTHLLRALTSRRDAESAHLAELRRRWAIEHTKTALDQGRRQGATMPGQPSPPQKGTPP